MLNKKEDLQESDEKEQGEKTTTFFSEDFYAERQRRKVSKKLADESAKNIGALTKEERKRFKGRIATVEEEAKEK